RGAARGRGAGGGLRAGALRGRVRSRERARGGEGRVMLARRIIPCLDVKAGRVVKGVRFEGLRDAGDPVECAARYDREGADELTFLDIAASSEERRILIDVVERTAEAIAIPLTVGGGVRERADVRDLLAAGADKVSMNTTAVRDPAFVDSMACADGPMASVLDIYARARSARTRVCC